MLKLSPELSNRLDLSLWSPRAGKGEYEAFFSGAAKLGVRAVCVPSSLVNLALSRLEDAPVKVVALAGFPLGNMDSDAKRYEAEAAFDAGAQEVEVVLNHALLKAGESKALLRELRDIVEIADERPVCVTAEVAWLSEEELVLACHLGMDSGITAFSTGTGFWEGPGATPSHVKMIREATSQRFVIKASPVLDQKAAEEVVSAGANLLGVPFKEGI